MSVLVSSSHAQSSDDFQNYTNKAINFTIQHPSKWKVEEDDAKQVYFTIRENKEEKKVNDYFSLPADLFSSFFRVSVEKPESYLDTNTMTVQNTSLQQRVQQELDTISLNNKELIRQNQVTVGGNPGWKIEYRDTDKYKDRYVFVIYTIADGKFYVLRYVEEPLKVPETLPLANKMVESFHIKK